MSDKVRRNFFLPKECNGFPANLFPSALYNLLAYSAEADKLIPSLTEKNTGEVQRKILFEAEEWQFFQELKSLFGLRHDRDLVYLTIRVARLNPIYT